MLLTDACSESPPLDQCLRVDPSHKIENLHNKIEAACLLIERESITYDTANVRHGSVELNYARHQRSNR